ncbi:M56 family metallopeptidase [Shimia marina]|uniref:Regulatory protein BlaR1 n=1 Tax=Shimia marina TaxID=321267 RepID=A0A0P1ESL5_9RHOB|nr:M56 family metallopeptidase [Shimia marina]CUH53409.1 Regulatory protein BlaR1 [Shimia marina]SFD77672.1 Signal transducer regulating beta-lactamase production, contains metallopeptidase domain [Shimia marina]
MTVDQIVGGAIWIQLVILLAACVFGAFEGILVLSGRRRSFYTRRRMGMAVIACLAVLPLVAPYLVTSPYAASVNATDAIVAQVLNGNLDISASRMMQILTLKSEWMSQVATASSTAAQVLIAGFLAAFIARTCYLVVNIARICNALKSGRVVQRTRRCRLVATSSVSVPFSTRGLWYYYVVLPEALIADRAAVQMALGHELQHIRQGDVDAEVLLSLISPIAVLNPGFWFLSSRLRKLGELACDRAYLARKGFDAHGYALRLLEVARSTSAAKQQPTAFGVPLVGRRVPFLSRRSMLKDRIVAIADHQAEPAKEAVVFGAFLSLVMAGVVLLGAVSLAEPEDWSHERIMLSTVANLDRLNHLNTLAQRSW